TGRTLRKQRGGHVAGPTADVEHTGFRPHKDAAEAARTACPPAPVEPHRKQMIQQVVARRDGVEDVANMLRGCGLGSFPGRPCRPRALLFQGSHASTCRLFTSAIISSAATSNSASLTSRTTVASPIPIGNTKERA